ncbi:TPA: hypothetical protein JZ210_002932 [Escherichia coli]|jgi:hypothetical protein|nr:hypothetical protein [Escherichia coli]
MMLTKRRKESALSYPQATLPDCPCGGYAALRGRYSTEGGRLTWYYMVYCSRCGFRIRLFGDIYQKSDAVTAWNRSVSTFKGMA